MADWSDYDTPRISSGWEKRIGQYVIRSKKIIVTPINWPTNNPLLKIKEDYKVELMKKDLVIPPQPLSQEERDKYLKEKKANERLEAIKATRQSFDDLWPDDWENWFPVNK
tara:strand:- start:2295 stop:2627 length:333 start_codon:yes stop_codon:yes gene_type:complete